MARGTISKRGSKWSVRFFMEMPDGSRKQKRLSGFSSQQEAEDALNKALVEERAGTYIPPSKTRVEEFVNIWLSDHVSQLAPKTQEHYKHTTNYIVKYLGRIGLSDLRANHIDKMYRDLKSNSPLSDNSIRHIHKTLRSMLNTAIRWEYLATSPIKKTSPPKKAKTVTQFWDVDDIRKAFDRLSSSPVYYHMQVSVYSGLRLGEVCGIREEDINFKHGYFTVSRVVQRIDKTNNVRPPKSQASIRRIPMCPELVGIFKNRIKSILENRMRYRGIYDDTWAGYLSVYETGELMSDQTVGRRWRKEMKRLNSNPDTMKAFEPTDPRYLKPIRFHDLRHSCASWLILNGVDMKTVQVILGHSDYATTADIYAHLCDTQIRDAMNTLSIQY